MHRKDKQDRKRNPTKLEERQSACKQTIQGVKKAHVWGRSESALRGKKLHDRVINNLMNGVFVQERSSITQPTYEEGPLPMQISSISPSIQNITRCINTAADGENIKLKRVIGSNPQSIEF